MGSIRPRPGLLRLSAERRERLHDAISRALERLAGETEVSYAANLYLAKLAP